MKRFTMFLVVLAFPVSAAQAQEPTHRKVNGPVTQLMTYDQAGGRMTYHVRIAEAVHGLPRLRVEVQEFNGIYWVSPPDSLNSGYLSRSTVPVPDGFDGRLDLGFDASAIEKIRRHRPVRFLATYTIGKRSGYMTYRLTHPC